MAIKKKRKARVKKKVKSVVKTKPKICAKKQKAAPKKRKAAPKKRKATPKKRRATAKRKTNPTKNVQLFVPFVVKDGVNYYYGGINFKTKGLKFYQSSKDGIKYNTRSEAVSDLKSLVTLFLRDKKMSATVGAVGTFSKK